ncbi:Transposase DDE domain-containing protein [Poseidonocella pacifica]|uniref:Transposase DDE domain-containing protein n=1 Tax=Poseidonocella pacifica TaxID=871651 RepID=A0A1I0UX87_9RHOB|nr:Transposase DDE domain-containing protein [Poseidonocella pacifica]
MSKPAPARYRTTNWSSYSASFRKRGSLLIWLNKDMTWLAPHDGRAGRPALLLPALLSDAAIQFCLTIKVLFKLSLRQTKGMAEGLAEAGGPRLGGAGSRRKCAASKSSASASPHETWTDKPPSSNPHRPYQPLQCVRHR